MFCQKVNVSLNIHFVSSTPNNNAWLLIVIRGNMANERGNKRFWTTYSPLLYTGRHIQAQNKVVRRASWQKRSLAFCCSLTTRLLCVLRDTSRSSPTIVCRLEWNVGVYKYLEELYTFVFCNTAYWTVRQLSSAEKATDDIFKLFYSVKVDVGGVCLPWRSRSSVGSSRNEIVIKSREK